MEFERLDLTELDKDLSEEQRKEWNAIYATVSFKVSFLPGEWRNGYYQRHFEKSRDRRSGT